ncbi:MAG: hypothetical protein AAGJ82_08320, partial [Bacteroidota bacterium]
MESWKTQRILHFFNRATSVKDIIKSSLLKDDPEQGAKKGYVIGQLVAERILDTRNRLPAQRFRTYEQLCDVKGLGTDKLHDLAKSLAIPADTYFQQRLFDNLLLGNWEVAARRTTFEDANTFQQVASSACALKAVVAEQLYGAPNAFGEELNRLQHLAIQNGYLEQWGDAYIGGYNFAIWWYLFDYDNWFTFERIQTVCNEYLGYHHLPADRIAFFQLRGISHGPMTATRQQNLLPIIVNHGERVVTT